MLRTIATFTYTYSLKCNKKQQILVVQFTYQKIMINYVTVITVVLFATIVVGTTKQIENETKISYELFIFICTYYRLMLISLSDV